MIQFRIPPRNYYDNMQTIFHLDIVHMVFQLFDLMT